MKKSEINQQQIEAYLLNQLSESEKAAFQTKLLFDKQLQAEVKRMRQLQKGITAEQQTVSTKAAKNKYWQWLLPLFVIGIMVVYWMSSSDKAALPNPANEHLDEAEDIFLPVEEPQEEQLPKIEEAPPIQEKKTPIKTPKPKQKSIKKEVPKAPKPIRYASNYTVNPVLENALASNLRGDYDFTIRAPKKDQTFNLEEDKITWEVSGELITDKEPEADFSLILEIYTNKKGAYQKEAPIVQVPIRLEKLEASKYLFLSNHSLTAERRLYYYLLRDDFSGIIFAGGKFRVE